MVAEKIRKNTPGFKKATGVTIICALLILLFVYAAISKLADFGQFTADMHNQPLPDFLKPVVIWAVPAAELIVATLLFFDTTRLAGLYASLALMGVFTFYTIVILLHFFKYVPCSCGGIIKFFSWPQHLVFNLFFVLIAATGIFNYRTSAENDKAE